MKTINGNTASTIAEWLEKEGYVKLSQINCNKCKFLKIVFDGVYSETWTCPKLKKVIDILNIPIRSNDIPEFSVKYRFGCNMFKPTKPIKVKSNETINIYGGNVSP